MKIACAIEYQGTGFKGWQKQAGLRTVQAEVEQALSKVANETIEVICAGRTDAGVHAYQQVIHFETQAKRENHSWMLGANSHLPREISVQWAQPAADDFHARFSATARRYRYFIINQLARPALMQQCLTWYHPSLDAEKMQQAAQYFLGEQDFSSVRSAECQSNTAMRNVHFVNVVREQQYIMIDIQANAFLHHMVRNIVGILLEVGDGRRQQEWVSDVLAAKDRTKAGVTAPANGLHMVAVEYPAQFSIPMKAPEAMAMGIGKHALANLAR